MGYIQRKRSRFGQTRTRSTASSLDLEAMNTTDPSRLAELCRLGSSVACGFSRGEDIATPEQEAAMAQNREAQAIAEREAISRKLLAVGINPQIAEAARTGQDVRYAEKKPEGPGFWDNLSSGFTSIFKDVAPMASNIYGANLQSQLQQDMLKRAIQPKRRQAPQTIIIPKKSNTNLYIGLGVAAAAMMMILGVVVIKKKKKGPE